MKKAIMTMFVVLLSAALLCPAFAQPGKSKDESAQDLVVKSQVETAVSMLQAIYAKQQLGEMTLEQAKKLGADLLQEMRYGTDGYIWALTTQGINVALYGRKDMDGKNRIEEKDAKGKFLIKEIIAKAAAGGGYVEYWFPKMGESQAQPKRSYVLPFKPFDWVVGAGYYR